MTVGLTVVALAMTSVSIAAEKKIARNDLPAAVQKTVDEQAKGAAIKGYATEVEKGMRLYEVELTVDGHSKDISMDGGGAVVEIEEEVSMASLSPSVKEGLTKRAGVGKITKVESLTKGGKLVAYEAVVRTGAKRSEIQVGPDGNKLAREE